MSEACLAVRVYPGHHPLPVARLARLLGRTTWTAGSAALARNPQETLHRWSAAALRCLGVEIRVEGTLHAWPQLWVANHLSWLDPIVLLSLRPMGALAKGEVGDYPLIGAAARRLGLAFVDRADPRSRASAVTRIASELRNGRPMLLFPEGTTTRGQALAPLQEGGLRAAYRCGSAVQPIRIASDHLGYPWTGDDSLLPHLLSISRTHATRVHLRAGQVLVPANFETEGAWLDAIRHHIHP